jgi:hypothetical protein
MDGLLSHLLRSVFGEPGAARRPARKVKRNPSAPRSEADGAELERAKALSRDFHGDVDVIELSESERRLPKYLVSLGTIPDLVYEPHKGSRRGYYEYHHEAGDRGIFGKKSRAKPILAMNPENRRPVIVPAGSPVRVNDDGELVG